MAQDFSSSVEDGLKLSARLYAEKERGAVAIAPKPVMSMEKSSENQFLPESPMLYAVIKDPSVVDNPDIPSYQPYVYGRLDPPALIPLHMKSVELQVDTYLDTSIVQLEGSWRLHCVMGSKSCDCRLALPLGLHGSVLGVEIEIGKKNYYTELISLSDQTELAKQVYKGLLTPNIFLLTLPKISGGSNISIKLRWMQKNSYNDGEFSLVIPFTFPDYVTPTVKKIPKKEKIAVNVNMIKGLTISCDSPSHPFKQLKRDGKASFLYEADVHNWSKTDLVFQYTVESSHIHGGIQVQSGTDWSNFCVSLFPGNQTAIAQKWRRSIVFVVDISKSMDGKPLETTKTALSDALHDLNSNDSFNIITFNGDTSLFSMSMVPANPNNIVTAVEWMNTAFVASGNTAMLQPLSQAIQMVSNAHDSVPTVFLVTDGSVENEKQICDAIKNHATRGGTLKPRVYSFGIGSFCNQYFLKMLAMISRGQHEAGYDIGSMGSRLDELLKTAMSTTLVNVSIDTFEDSNVEIFQTSIPDLTAHKPIIISGRVKGQLPKTVEVTGLLVDQKEFSLKMEPQIVEDPNFNLVLAKQQIDILTAQGWLTSSKETEERVISLSTETGIPSENTVMALMDSDKVNPASEAKTNISIKSPPKSSYQKINIQAPRRLYAQTLGVGFGNLTATEENLPPGRDEPKLPEAAEILIRATSNCCEKMCNRCCCMCCIMCCSKMNNQTATLLAQCCMALTWLGCFECCSAICCGGNNQ